ncbi:MAG: hypothetical protein ABEJ91_00335 [Candidatus Nanohaloarchaea archaeon]
MDREKIREIAEREDWRQKRKAAAGILVVSVIVFAGALMINSSSNVEIPEAPETGSNDSGSGELTEYQKSYVDCPDQYMPLCTKMSKIPTEPVRYQKVEGNQLYLELPRSDRTLVAQIKHGGESGYLISIRE